MISQNASFYFVLFVVYMTQINLAMSDGSERSFDSERSFIKSPNSGRHTNEAATHRYVIATPLLGNTTSIASPYTCTQVSLSSILFLKDSTRPQILIYKDMKNFNNTKVKLQRILAFSMLYYGA
jgi:hypothetical protein